MLFQPNLSPSRSFLGGLLERARKAVFPWDEIRGLDAREIQAIARDLNLSAAELNALAFAPNSAESLGTRLAYAGLSEDELAISHCDVLRDLQRVCGQCPSRVRCAADLRRGKHAAPSKYCPNEQTLRALSVEAHERPSGGIPPVQSDRD